MAAAVHPVRRVLTELTRVEGVRGAILVNKEGFVIDAVVPGGEFNQDAVAAMITGIVQNVESFGREFNLGGFTLITIEYDNGIAFAENLGDVYLVIMAERGAVIGRIRYEIQKQKDRIKAAL